MILSTRESPEMRRELLRVGMSQMSAGSRTDVGAYHRDAACPETETALGRDLAGQFSLMDHRPVREIVASLLRDGYVPSWCTACYRKGRTGPEFMAIARAGRIHDFCHPNSLLTLQEYLRDYGSPEEVALGEAAIAREGADPALSPGARRLLQRKLAKVQAGEHDVYV
jgi:2-iminoacetate synthase